MSDENNETNSLLRELIGEIQRPRKEAEEASAAAERGSAAFAATAAG